ncbi:putative hydrolase C777.06c [Pistacia vera]|uniref:putative hydrolase C777.06c n=1 Tax=Pistacia vera TaxID=55513 RepID=UPI001263B9B8|nr:putative hydrolase C777.06c [Pistacia vera]
METVMQNETDNGVVSTGSSLIFLGTGCSSALPNTLCLIRPSDPPCNVCYPALSLPPHLNPNYRCNTSLLIDYCESQSDDKHSYILIDVGKTFREQVLRWFTFHKIPRVDSIILTHEHADAVLGLDDIRAVQPYSATNDIDPTPVYLTQFAMESVSVKFPYLVRKKLKEGQEIRRVAQVDWKIIEEQCDKPFVASGLKFFPLPVMHGEDYVSLGFLFGEKCTVAYISDISRFPSSTEYVISKSGAGQLDLLILDTLYKTGSHNTHFCFPQTLEAVKRLCPKRALLVGMTHEFDHHKDNDFLVEWSKREGIPVQLAHDGLRIPIDL